MAALVLLEHQVLIALLTPSYFHLPIKAAGPPSQVDCFVFVIVLSMNISCAFNQCVSDTSPQKCMRFNPDATVWVAKQRILCTLNQSLKDVLNYGLFQPASNGRDGKFLDEERTLREYPQPISKGVPALEVN